MKKSFKFIFYPVIILMINACGSGEKIDDSLDHMDSTRIAVEETKLNAQNVFNTMPDRKEILKLIESHQIDYNADLLNDPNFVDKYTIESAKAVNLGVYGSDLSIASAFEQTQESIIFLKCVNVLAGDLGVNNAFDQSMFDRMEANKSSKDSTLEIITNAFKSADQILKTNNRPATSAIILSGAWIEGLYVSCKITESLNSDEVAKSILSQEESLKNLIILLEASKLNDRSDYILHGLKKLHDIFAASMQTEKTGFEAIKDISEGITALRTKVVSGI
ncbi:MAG: hypothetical protein IPM51_14630 [Sphingobacteriaceae bacterium]|nr:hypothetical protein [Sphingobacteriaceae bacterium]